MDFSQISPEGDLPPNHPLVLEALKGIIAGPISELRTKVDANIVDGLKKGHIDYDKILPTQAQSFPSNQNGFDQTSLIANNILNQMAPVQYVQPVQVLQNHPVQVKNTNSNPVDPDQMELPLFRQPDVSDLHKKLYDIERKMDIILKYVKNSKN